MPTINLPDALVYSLSGEDAAIFQINAATGEVSYQNWFTPSYADVWDMDRDHIYEISVIGSNGAGVEVGRVELKLVVSETDAVWQEVDGGSAVASVDPSDVSVYTLSGEDAAIFQVNAATGEVSYQSWFTPSYAEVWDADRDHIYEVTVIESDGSGAELSRAGLELVVSETDAVWRDAEAEQAAPGGPVDPVDPVDAVDPTAPSDAVSYVLAGEDASVFLVNAATGEVSYQNWFTPSYAENWDLDRDHIYEVIVIGFDSVGLEVSRTGLELVVSETDAVWRTVDGTDPIDPVDPADPVDSTEGVTYTLGGDDASIFQVNSITGEVSYQSWFTPSYSEVWDLDRDHIYEITVTGTDAEGVEISQTGLELVVSETDAVWRTADGSGPVDPVDPVDPTVPVDPSDPVAPVVDIVRLDTNPSETIYGIRDDTSSRGVDLAGAVIVATYADGTFETLAWEAYDPYTLGGAEGTYITMAYGWSEHDLTVTKELTSLRIDLAPSSSVFDTTDTLDDDPLGGSTLGSSFGYEFKFLGEYDDLGGTVTVTYSSVVNIVGSPAQGDLYTTMFVDFSDLPDGGILGDVTWNSDIDTLKYLGDLAPAGTSDAYAANDIVMGTAADDFLNGAGGEDVFTGSAGNDVLTGGSGADAFIFMDGSGEDVIVDFDILGGDILNIQAFGFADPDAVLTVSTDVGSDVLIQLDANDSVMLTDVTTAELSATDHWLLSL